MGANLNHQAAEPGSDSGRWPWARVFVPGIATAFLATVSAPGYAHGRALPLMAWITFVPLLLVLPTLSRRQAALSGLVAGCGTSLGWAAWMPGLMARFSGWPPSLALAATLALALISGGGWSLWSYIVRRLDYGLPFILGAPAAFVVMERWFPTVFPWSLGLAHYRSRDVSQIAELGGPFVISFLEVLVAAMASHAWWSWRRCRRIPWRGLTVVTVVLVASVGSGHMRRTQIEAARARAPSLRMAAVQAGTVASGWRAQVAPNLLGRYRAVTKDLERNAGRFDLVVWPEKVSPVLRKDAAHDYPPGHARRIGDDFLSPLLFGAETIDVDTRERRNSAALLLPDRQLRVVYSKVELIVWSEWLPGWAERRFGRRYRPGGSVDPVVVPVSVAGQPAGDSLPVGAFICFEAAFPSHVRTLVARGAQLLVNLSDDRWFGDSAEPEQHLAQAVFRAIETRRDLLRAAGSGISAFITATGEVERRLPLSLSDAPVVLVAEPRRLRIASLAARLGNTFGEGCAVVALVGVLMARRRGRKRGAVA